MKCLMKYQRVKLLRSHLPEGKGLMGAWVRLASRAAFRRGKASYCGYINDVTPGMWSGGIVGVKSILGVKTRKLAFEILDKLSALGYIRYELNEKTKKLSYYISDWVVKCSGEECMTGAVYTTEGYGFLCLPRNITQRLAEQKYIFDESDAWLDLWCHSISQDPNNAFSFLSPTIQYAKYGAVLTLETLGDRWGWEKTKVWRFLKKHRNVFTLYRLPGSYGCLIFNKLYPCDTEVSLPTQAEIVRILDEIRIFTANTQKCGSDHDNLNRSIAWYSKNHVPQTQNQSCDKADENRVALSAPILRAYISQCWNCKNCEYDCGRILNSFTAVVETNNIRGPCAAVDITKIEKENFTYE